MRIFFSVLFFILTFFSQLNTVSAQSQANKPEKGAFSSRILSLFSSVSERVQISTVISPTKTPAANWSTISEPVTLPTKTSYKIAVVGDSMVDTMGENLEYLERELKQKYPGIRFYLYNYGKGAQNVDDGLERFFNEFNYQDRRYPSLLTVQPDILIIGTFSYNPFSPHDPYKHITTLSELLKQGQTISQDMYLLLEQAPLKANFGKGPNGVNWDSKSSSKHSGNILEQIVNAKSLAYSLQLKTIDIFTPSYNPSTGEGNQALVNLSDGIHPSVKGHEHIAEAIVNTIVLK